MWLSKHVSRKRALVQNLISIGLLLTVILLLVLLGQYGNRPVPSGDGTDTRAPQTEDQTPLTGEVMLTIPKMENIPLIYDVIPKAMASLEPDQTILQALNVQPGDNMILYRGLPVTLDLSGMAKRDGKALLPTRVEVSESADFSEVRSFEMKDGQTRLEIYLLKTGMKYYYRVWFADTDTMAQGSFSTAQSPRLLTIANIVNVRDIGGWETVDGKRIKQGMLYRGSELDGAVKETYLLTAQGRQNMLDVLGIRYDMDLRGADENLSTVHALGDGVPHVYYGIMMYDFSFTNANAKQAMRRVFADLADPENYPMYLHCTYGCDRTGTVCYLLEAILGLSDKDLLLEYELSSLHSAAVDRNYLLSQFTQLNAFPGETTREKAENYLLSIGVTAEEMDSIRSILLEDIPEN